MRSDQPAEPMTEVLTEAFCERCGTRYTFEWIGNLTGPLGAIGRLGRGFRHFGSDPGSSLDEAFAVARSEPEQRATTRWLEAFHRTFTFCLSCRQFTCPECWNAVEGRCLTCAPTPDTPAIPETRMDTAVMLAPVELASPPAPMSVESQATAAPRWAPESPVQAQELLPRPPPARSSRRSTTQRSDRRSWAPPRSRDAVAALAVTSVGVVIVLLIASELGGDPSPTQQAAQPTTAVAADTAVPWKSVGESFDELPMNSKLPDPWSVGGAGLAAIVPLPTSVDRSVRISSSVDGVRTDACRPLDTTAGSLQITFDYRLGSLPATVSRLLSIRSKSVTVLGIDIASDGQASLVARGADAEATAEAPGSRVAPVTPAVPTEWQRLQISVDPASGKVGWDAHDSAGAETGSGSTLTDLGSASLDTLCILSPDGSPSGWVAIDDLVVTG
jgi:hypothetical protein